METVDGKGEVKWQQNLQKHMYRLFRLPKE